jgi:hypothetical protein
MRIAANFLNLEIHCQAAERKKIEQCCGTATVNLIPTFFKGEIDTTILWVRGYARNRYMNAQTLYVSQGLGIVHGPRCRAPTLTSSRRDRAHASRLDHALRRNVRIPSNILACMQAKRLISRPILGGAGTPVRMLALDV